MAKETGKYSRVNGIVCSGYFEIDLDVMAEPVWCSDSAGGPILVDAGQDWGAKVIAFGYQPGILPGEVFQFEGMTYGGVGWQSGATGALATRMELNVPAWPAQPIWYSLDIGGNGALTPNASLTADSMVVPTPASGLGRAITIGGVAVTGCVGSKLILECLASEWGDTDAAGWMQRTSGGWNAAVQYRVNLDGIANIPAVNTDLVVTVPVTDSLSWAVNWMRVLKRKPVYDHGARDGKPKIVAMDVILGWNTVKDGSRGVVTAPDGTTVWPTVGTSSSSGA
jgi:hypothetical protein